MYSIDDYTCPICMYIMIQPVTMPCKHSLCMICYKQCVEKASLTCPFCRLRISVWARKNGKSNTLVDKAMWETIQRRFPDEVRNRTEGKDDSTDDNWDSPSAIEIKLRKIKELSEPGAIRQEYEAALSKLEKQREEDMKKEEEASAALIMALQEEEAKEHAKLVKQRDEHERLGRLAAEKIQVMNTERSCKRDIAIDKDSKKKCQSASMKLESFYDSFRKSSAPAFSELATTLSNGQNPNSNHGTKTVFSPYPYPCFSPNEKQKVDPSIPFDSAVDKTDDMSTCSKEHHTTASAEKIDLTLSENNEWTSILRDNVQQYIKVETPDLEENPLAGFCNDSMEHTFQPICSSLKTPPKKASPTESADTAVVRSIPQSLTFCFSEETSVVSPHSSTGSSEIFPDCSSECMDFADKEFQTNFDCKTKKKSTSQLSHIRHSTGEKEKGDFVDKINLTRKIVYGSNKYKKHNQISSTLTSSHSKAEVLHTSQIASTSSSFKSSQQTTDLLEFITEAKSPNASVSDNLSKTANDADKKTCGEDYFITKDTQLIIPLESEMINCNKSHNTDRKYMNALKHKLPVKKNTVKNVGNPCNTSIRNWCLKGKGKRERQSDLNTDSDTDSSVGQATSAEDADHQLALELQKLYDKQDRYHISVDRFQGSSNEYQFRKKRKLR